MLLRFYLLTTKTGCPEPVNKPYCDEAFAGIHAAEQELFGATFTDHWDEFYTKVPEEEEVAILGVQQLPALIVYDVERQMALFKMEAGEIRRTNVQAACMTAWKLTPDPADPEGYILPSGQSVQAGELIKAKPCPQWVPGFLCNSYGASSWKGVWSLISWVAIIVLLVLIFKTLRR